MVQKQVKKKKILVVEDEKPLLQVISDSLTKEGFNVVEAKNGKDGLDLAFRERPDLILLDILMPKMDGMEMMRELRKDWWGKTIPIMILTNLDDTEKIAEALEDGVYDYLVKTNFELRDVVKRIKEKLKVN